MNKNRLNSRNNKIERKYGISNPAKNFRFRNRYGCFNDVTTNPESQYPD